MGAVLRLHRSAARERNRIRATLLTRQGRKSSELDAQATFSTPSVACASGSLAELSCRVRTGGTPASCLLTRSVTDLSCSVAWRHSQLQTVCDLLLGRSQAEFLLHHLDEDGLVLSGKMTLVRSDSKVRPKKATLSLHSRRFSMHRPLGNALRGLPESDYRSVPNHQDPEAELQPELMPHSAGTTSSGDLTPSGSDKPWPCFRRAVTIGSSRPLYIPMKVKSLERFGEQVRHDLVEDDVPGFAGPWDFVNVQDCIILPIVETEQLSQCLLLHGSEGKILFLGNHGFPGQEGAIFQPIHKETDRIIQAIPQGSSSRKSWVGMSGSNSQRIGAGLWSCRFLLLLWHVVVLLNNRLASSCSSA